MNAAFEYTSALEYRLKAQKQELDAFKSGEKYVQIQEDIRKMIRFYEREIKKRDQEICTLRQEIVKNREYWFEVFEDLEKEYARKTARLHAQNKKLEQRALRAEQRSETLSDKKKELLHELYAVKVQLEEEKGKNLKLTAQLNRDYENSSIPSSKSIHHKKISNSREKTGRLPGGQPGHKGHGRKRQIPTCAPVLLPPPEEVLADNAFKKTEKTIKKQLVGIRMLLEVKEYHADVYYNPQTGERVHAAFPNGIKDDVNYDGSIRAFLFLLNNDCCTFIDKSRKFLSDLTGGKLNISKGMISKLSQEFALKTEPERRKAYADMLLSPVMHTDCTNAKMNGKNVYVYVCATPKGEALYYAREKKGHEGVKGTVTEDYLGILVHDHDKTFYNYGADHQECLAHVLRYLKDSIENEPDCTWNKKMHSLLQEMIHFRNGKHSPQIQYSDAVLQLEKRYLEILETARNEYEYVPPNKYYRDGYNLFRRMEKYKENHLLFLHDARVPATNNEAERLLRNYKRKQAQAVTFRSFESIDYLCQCMSMLVLMRLEDPTNIFDRVSKIFG